MFDRILTRILGVLADLIVDRLMQRIDDIVDSVMAHPQAPGSPLVRGPLADLLRVIGVLR